MEMSMVFFRKYIDELYKVAGCLLAFSIPFSKNLSVWVLTVWTILFLIRKIDDSIGGNREVIVSFDRRILPSILLLSLIFLGLLSAFVAAQPSLVFAKVFGSKFTLLLFPLLTLLDHESVDFSRCLRFFILGNIAFIAYSLGVVCWKYWVDQDIELHRNLLRYCTEVCTLIVHRTYSGVNILLSYVALYYLAGREKVTKRFLCLVLFYLLLTLFFLLLNNSRTITLAALLLLIGFGISYMIRGNKRIFLFLLGFTLFMVGAFVVLPSRTKDLMKTDHFIESFQKDPRARIWPAAYELGCDKPLLGYGLNNVTVRLVDKYLETGFWEGAAQKYGPHNEYLNAWLQLGVVGILLFLALLVSIPLCVSRERRPFALFFTLVCAFVFLTEAMMDRYQGCLTFSFFLALLAKNDRKIEDEISDERIRFVGSLLLVILPMVGMLLTMGCAKSNQESAIIRKGFVADEDYKLRGDEMVSFMLGETCVSYLPVAFCELPGEEKRRFEVECRVSEDFDASTVKIIAEEDMEDGSVRPTECHYDLGRGGEWQTLSVDVMGRCTVVIYLFGEKKLSFNDLQGEAFFRNPRFMN